MAKKSNRGKKASAKSGCFLCNPSTWLIGLLALALLVVCGVSVYGFKSIEQRNSIDARKIAVFDDMMQTYFYEAKLNAKSALEQKNVTGYGISDEDGVFYVTFDMAMYDGESPANLIDKKYGIMYFWPDKERGDYSHAYSYHDDASYHPGGIYVKL